MSVLIFLFLCLFSSLFESFCCSVLGPFFRFILCSLTTDCSVGVNFDTWISLCIFFCSFLLFGLVLFVFFAFFCFFFFVCFFASCFVLFYFASVPISMLMLLFSTLAVMPFPLSVFFLVFFALVLILFSRSF